MYGVLLRIDQDLAAAARSGGCPCGGRLHSARYPRKPRCGVELEKLDAEYGIRFSFCCEREGCRRRTTPVSVRFLGRRVYIGAVVVLIAALAEGATPTRLRRLARLVGGVSRRTIERWRCWWREEFPRSPTWRERRAWFAVPVRLDRLPATLFECAPGADNATRLVWLLRLVSPITSSGAGSPGHGS